MGQPEQDSVRDVAVDWAVLNGLVMAAAKTEGVVGRSVGHAPFALVPAAIPQSCFEAARDLQPLFNALVHSVAADAAFLAKVMDRWVRGGARRPSASPSRAFLVSRRWTPLSTGATRSTRTCRERGRRRSVATQLANITNHSPAAARDPRNPQKRLPPAQERK
ncbi:eukaryotic glutathione synthase [Chytriomyces sp. MP71]|nr:eukaryotic glutathione synthase [Chytriomyces sp. MP71]